MRIVGRDVASGQRWQVNAHFYCGKSDQQCRLQWQWQGSSSWRWRGWWYRGTDNARRLVVVVLNTVCYGEERGKGTIIKVCPHLLKRQRNSHEFLMERPNFRRFMWWWSGRKSSTSFWKGTRVGNTFHLVFSSESENGKCNIFWHAPPQWAPHFVYENQWIEERRKV